MADLTISTVAGWSFARWAYVAAWHHRAGFGRPIPTFAGACRMQACWRSAHPIHDPWERPTSADMDFAWAAALFDSTLREMAQDFRRSGIFRANLGQEKGAGDHESPTP